MEDEFPSPSSNLDATHHEGQEFDAGGEIPTQEALPSSGEALVMQNASVATHDYGESIVEQQSGLCPKDVSFSGDQVDVYDVEPQDPNPELAAQQEEHAAMEGILYDLGIGSTGHKRNYDQIAAAAPEEGKAPPWPSQLQYDSTPNNKRTKVSAGATNSVAATNKQWDTMFERLVAYKAQHGVSSS